MEKKDIVPDGLYYSKDHEWVRVEGNIAVIGISDHAQHALGEITYVDLPRPGKKVKQSGELAAVESAKAASDVYSPLSGEVAEVNEALNDEPQKVNAEPYGAGWICKLKGIAPDELKNLLSAEAYRQMLGQEPK